MTRPAARNRPALALLLLATALAAAACNAEFNPPVAEEIPRQQELGEGRIAHLAIVSHNALGRLDSALDISAQFAEFGGFNDQQVRQSLGIWSPDRGRDHEHCGFRGDGRREALPDPYAGRIELLDAGLLTVESDGDRFEMRPRALPPLLPFLDGVTYGTDALEGPLYRPGTEVRVNVQGGHVVDGFSTSLPLPEPLSLSYVDGTAVGSAESLDVNLDDDLVVLWEPLGAGETVTLVLEPEIDSAGALSCTALDDGAFRLPATAISALRGPGGPRALRLTLRRAHVEELNLPGFDQAEAVAVCEHSVVLY